jgi:hypothetical protein
MFFIIIQTETNVLKLLVCILDTIALKFAIGLHKLVAVIFEKLLFNRPWIMNPVIQ